jgi:transcriptional regulator with XRE-family HTH domain
MARLGLALGRRIQELRKRADFTQQELADKTRIECKYLADIEHGRRSPSLDVLERLVQALGIQHADLFSFGPEGKAHRSNPDIPSILMLLRRMRPSETKLILSIIKGMLRSRPGSRSK